MLEHPTLLLGSAQSNPDNVWLRAFDGVNDFAILLRSRRTKRRAVSSRHYHAGKPGDKLRSEVLRNTRRARSKPCRRPIHTRGIPSGTTSPAEFRIVLNCA